MDQSSLCESKSNESLKQKDQFTWLLLEGEEELLLERLSNLPHSLMIKLHLEKWKESFSLNHSLNSLYGFLEQLLPLSPVLPESGFLTHLPKLICLKFSNAKMRQYLNLRH